MTQHSASQHQTLPEALCNIQVFWFTLLTFPFIFTFFHQGQCIASMVLKMRLWFSGIEWQPTQILIPKHTKQN